MIVIIKDRKTNAKEFALGLFDIKSYIKRSINKIKWS